MSKLVPNKELIESLEKSADRFNASARYAAAFNAEAEAAKNRKTAAALQTAAQALRDLEAAKKPVAEGDAAVIKGDLGTIRKLLVRASDMARADKSASITTSSAVRGNIDTAVMLLDRVAKAVAKKPTPRV